MLYFNENYATVVSEFFILGAMGGMPFVRESVVPHLSAILSERCTGERRAISDCTGKKFFKKINFPSWSCHQSITLDDPKKELLEFTIREVKLEEFAENDSEKESLQRRAMTRWYHITVHSPACRKVASNEFHGILQVIDQCWFR